MKRQKVTFNNSVGDELVGILNLPDSEEPNYYVLFAHCFTCNKNLNAVENISKALTKRGAAVLRFDFTGLGESEGDFTDTRFSNNISDLICAANYLAENYNAPKLLIGHSLGGAAVLCAGKIINSVTAIATIGAPSDPVHVSHLLKGSIEEIKEKGEAPVNIGGREFVINKQFIEDLEEQNLEEKLENLRTAVLIMHAPQDTIVGIENAAAIYAAAHHPKSFISLDGADHLLSKKEDSLYAGEVIAAWGARYLCD